MSQWFAFKRLRLHCECVSVCVFMLNRHAQRWTVDHPTKPQNRCSAVCIRCYCYVYANEQWLKTENAWDMQIARVPWFSSAQFIFSFHRSALNLENVAEYRPLARSHSFTHSRSLCSRLFDSSAFPFVIISERLVQDFVMLYVHLFRWKHNNYNLRNGCNSPKQWQLKPVVLNNNRTHIIVSMCKTNKHTTTMTFNFDSLCFMEFRVSAALYRRRRRRQWWSFQ